MSSEGSAGLDYFLARHYASNLARFLQSDSPSYASLKDPQSWNLYAYTLSNPLRYTDPDGHDVKCKSSSDKCLQGARASVANAEAASRLYVTTKTEKAGWFRRVFLGQKTVTNSYLAIRGSVESFKALGQNASRMADLITDKRVFGLSVSTTRSITYKSRVDQFVFGSTQPVRGGFSITSFQQAEPEAWINPYEATYKDDKDAERDGIPPANFGERTAHELLGHVWAAEIKGLQPGTAEHKQAVLDAENEVRRTDPTRGQKTKHHD